MADSRTHRDRVARLAGELEREEQALRDALRSEEEKASAEIERAHRTEQDLRG